jgi:hypothetical protein
MPAALIGLIAGMVAALAVEAYVPKARIQVVVADEDVDDVVWTATSSAISARSSRPQLGPLSRAFRPYERAFSRSQ